MKAVGQPGRLVPRMDGGQPAADRAGEGPVARGAVQDARVGQDDRDDRVEDGQHDAEAEYVVASRLDVASMKYCIGTADLVSLASDGEPTIVAVIGISSAATVITSDHRIARAMLRLVPVRLLGEVDRVRRSRCRRRSRPR